MLRLIRVRLALSYAGIALLVTLSLGAVLLLRLRAYYGGMELDYLHNNARAIGGLAVPLLTDPYPKEVQDAQVQNLAFLSQTRVRILDNQKTVIADSGPWQSPLVDLGMVRSAKIEILKQGGIPAAPSSVIVLQKSFPDGQAGASSAFSGAGGESVTAPVPRLDASVDEPGGPQSNIVYFNSSVPVSNGVYGLYLSRSPVEIGSRSSQKVLAGIRDSSGTTLGYVELSESPAYGREIVTSVAYGLAVAGGLAILLAIVAGWVASKRFTAPLSSLTDATQRMSSGDLAVRVAEASCGDEFGVLGKSFNQMAGQIEDTVGTLRRFLADAAHELQTPLTALRTNLELARGESNSPSTDQSLVEALAQIERLQRMMKDLLSLSRLESAAGPEDFQPVDLAELVRQVSEPYAARAEQAGQQLDLDLPDSACPVMGSPEKLRGALANLLDNALKFTPPGGEVLVQVYAEQDAYCLAVTDSGIGIPPDEIEMLFNRFHRGRNASPYPGSGLGLAIVRAIAQAHGGGIQGENNPEGGARFVMRLPIFVPGT
jgi:signal transduction histidine kinase